MKRLVLDGRMAEYQWDVQKTISALHDIPASSAHCAIWYPNDIMTEEFVNTAIRDKKLLKNCFAVIIHSYGVEYFYWN